MQLTLIEVLGFEAGAGMYSMDWLCSRVLWHLDPVQCTGNVFVVEALHNIRGHAIVGVEEVGNSERTGLFSTIYVVPASRRRGLGKALLLHAEGRLMTQNVRILATNTADSNEPLIRLFTSHGYDTVLPVPDVRMVRLLKTSK